MPFSPVEKFDAEALVSVTVTFNPDLSELAKQFAALPEGVLKVVVDNASRGELVAGLADLVERTPHAHLVRNLSNEGLPAAQNRGVEEAIRLDPSRSALLLLDQDSEPEPGSVQVLLDALTSLQQAGLKVGAVGPRLVDEQTGLQHGFHQASRWRWRRVFPVPGDPPLPIANINGSGTLMPIAVFRTLGGLEEDLFIDHVDTEWSFRLLAAGFGLFGVPAAAFRHRMGERSMRFWLLGWRVWPTRSPQRHCCLFRNATRLMRRRYVPRVWKCWAVVKLALTVVVTMTAGPQRRLQLLHMARGVRTGLEHRGQDHA